MNKRPTPGFMSEAEYNATLCETCGTYGDKPHSPLCDNAKAAGPIVKGYKQPAPNSIRHPHNRTEANTALNIRRGTGRHRHVVWHYFETRRRNGALGGSDHWDINVKAGNTMHVTVYSGIPFLDVRSGHVTVEFHSAWGNSVTVHAGASAHVIVPSADTKVTITVEPGGTYTMDIPEGKNRVYYPEKYPERANWFENGLLKQD